MIRRLLNNEILIKSILTMLVQGLGQVSAFIVAILLARYFAVAEYGAYIFGVTMATIIAVIATLGADGMLARSWGWSALSGEARNHWVFHCHNWFWRRSIPIVILLVAMAWVFALYSQSTTVWIEIFALSFAFPFLIANLLQSFFVATKRVVFANLIQLGLRLIMLASVLVFFFYWQAEPVSLIAMMLILMTAYIVLIWLKMSHKHGLVSSKPQGSNLAFMLLKWGNLLLAQIDIVILKIFSTNTNIAYYGVALQLSALVVFVLNAVSSNIIAQVAHDYKHCDRDNFQRKVTGYTRIIVALSSIVLITLIVAGYWITLLYGEDYTKAYGIFCVLMIGQAVNVMCGSVFTILNMSGHEKITCRVFYQALILNIVLGVTLIYPLGVYGVAIASAIAMIYWNIYLVIEVYRKVGVNPTIFKRLEQN